MHVILVNKTRRKESEILSLSSYLVWIHHELGKHGWPVKCQHADENCRANNGISNKHDLKFEFTKQKLKEQKTAP